MKKYIITFIGNVDNELLVKSGAKNIKTLENIKSIAFCEMEEQDAKNLINKEYKNIKDVEENIDYDIDDIDDNDNGQQVSYALPQMEVDKFHELGFKGQGVKVAVMDRGCQRHEDLNITAGFPSNYHEDTNGHGTHVAGIIGMLDNDIGYLGTAPECDLYIIKRDAEEGITGQITGMDWAITNNIDIVNCSFSSSTDYTARREAFRVAAEEHDIIIITSSGNRQSDVPIEQDTMGYPSRYPFTYAVANVDNNKIKANSSSCGSQVEFSAGGQNIMSTARDTGATTSTVYESKSGTSMAAPAVAGLVALYKQMYPELGRVELMRKVQDNSERIGDKWIFGAGIPQFPKEMYDIKMNNWNVEDEKWENLFPETKAKNITDIHGVNLQDFIDSMNFIIEENEHGYYVQFPNGLQICWAQPFEQAPNEESGVVYRSESKSWIFPHPFINEDYFVTASTGVAGRWADASGSGSTTSVSIRQYGGSVDDDTLYPTKTFAVGRWK